MVCQRIRVGVLMGAVMGGWQARAAHAAQPGQAHRLLTDSESLNDTEARDTR
jgi:hypothetical protein